MDEMTIDRLIASAKASFEIEGIEVTESMIDCARRILIGEVTGRELNQIYIESLKIKKENE